MNKNADIDKYKYSGRGIAFERGLVYSFGNRFDRNVIIFGVKMSSSVHVDENKKDILIIGKCPTQGLTEHSLTAGKIYRINFTENKEKYCLTSHYNGANGYLFVNSTEINKFKAKGSEIVATPLCLAKVSKDWSKIVKETG